MKRLENNNYINKRSSFTTLEEFKKRIKDYSRNLTNEEKHWSATLSFLEENVETFFSGLHFVNEKLKSRRRMIDLGCGLGHVTKLIGEILGFDEIYGVDYEEKALKKAKERGIKVLKADLNYTLPFPDKYFDLAISFGVLDHLVWWDTFFSEANRILNDNGLLIIYMTNLGSWSSRISLLLGYQPRHIEISTKILAGVHRRYLESSTPRPVGHIRTCTLRAMLDISHYYGFKSLKVYGLKMPSNHLLIKLIDNIASKFPTLSERYLLILEKEG